MATKEQTIAVDTTAAGPQPAEQQRDEVFNLFRTWGHLQATLDPLGQYLPPEPFPVAPPEGEYTSEARGYYCGNIAAEFMHIANNERRQWLQSQMEQTPAPRNRARILTQLIRAEVFEQVIQSRYLGTKRFSLEGLTVLIPFLDAVFESSAPLGVEKSVFAMSHRGRLNVMTNTVGRNASEVFAKFEDVDPRSVLGGGDVKYHVGATGTYTSPEGRTIDLHLASNPSHLEAVDPVALGRTRAKQMRLDVHGSDNAYGKLKVLPMVIHGDAAFAGQGIFAETLVLTALPGYEVGGTIHIIVNNLLGFTALPEESNSSRYASDLAKRLPIPVLHVNAEDPDAVVRVAGIAAEYRHRFGSDIVIDLVGYRRHGHSEVDDPTVTQPRRYAIIKDHPTLYQLYAKQIGVDPAAEVAEIQNHFLEDQKTASHADHKPRLAQLPDYWTPFNGGDYETKYEVITGIKAERVAELVRLTTNSPEGFHIHPKVKKLFEQRLEMGAGKRLFDYGMAELVAYASLLTEAVPRAPERPGLTAWNIQSKTCGHGRYRDRTALHPAGAHIAPEAVPVQPRFEVYNSMLSEAAVLGFEYGYSRDYPEALVLWEAQFGDFANGAQIIIDQFIAAGEAKWGLFSGIVMLLPHGYEGQGPEHSSARMERYLQLAAHDNIQVCQPSNAAAQYFHLLRRQAIQAVAQAAHRLHAEEHAAPSRMHRPPWPTLRCRASRMFFPDNDVKGPAPPSRLQRKDRPQPARRTREAQGFFRRHPVSRTDLSLARGRDAGRARPAPRRAGDRMGTGRTSKHGRVFLRDAAPEVAWSAIAPLTSVKRSASASPATGSAKAHEMEERTLIDLGASGLATNSKGWTDSGLTMERTG